MREMTANEARLRSALEAALVALEVAADPANDIDPEGFGLIARVCRRALEETGGPVVPRQVCPCGEIIDDFGACATCDASAKSEFPMASCTYCGAEFYGSGDDCGGCRLEGDDLERYARSSARPHDPRADRPEAALNPRDVRELSLESIARDGGR